MPQAVGHLEQREKIRQNHPDWSHFQKMGPLMHFGPQPAIEMEAPTEQEENYLVCRQACLG